MKLDKAIELVEEDTKHPTAQFTPELVKAEKLLIEAGKCIEHLRSKVYYYRIPLLPGETK